jgi:hypothetical protein
MKLTRATIGNIKLPHGKKDIIETRKVSSLGGQPS